jgi:nucleotide sugar dehydrogenase
VNIALVNELALFANQLGVNVWESIDAASTKPFGYMRFTPGPGVGGHCLPVDPSYLSWQVKRKLGRNFRFVELANDVNDHMPDYVVQRVTSLLNKKEIPVSSAKILLLGLSYKKNSGDIREAPSTRIIELLEESGAKLSAIDNHVKQNFWPKGVNKIDGQSPDYSTFDVALLITDHDDIDLQNLVHSGVSVFDTRNQLSGNNVEVL